MRLEYECEFFYSQKCEPCGTLGFRLSKGWEPETIFKSLDRKGEVEFKSGSNASIMVMLIVCVWSGERWCRKRVDQLFLFGGQKSFKSKYGKFRISIIESGLLLDPPSDDDMRTLHRRSQNSRKHFFSVTPNNQYLFEYARGCEQCAIQQPEGMVPGEFYWFCQSQYGAHLSLDMHLNHLKWALLSVPKFDTPEQMAELIKEKLTCFSRCITYVSDEIDDCKGLFVEEKSGVLPLSANVCNRKRPTDIASCPFDIDDHSMLCGDCEDYVTVSFNQSFQDKSLSRHLTQSSDPLFPLLKRVLDVTSKYTFCPMTVLTVDDPKQNNRDSLFRRNKQQYSGMYDFGQRDSAEFSRDLTPHMTMVAFDRRLLDFSLKGLSDPPDNVMPTFLVESTRWMYAREPSPEMDGFLKIFRKFKSRHKFKHKIHKPDWFFVATAVYSEELRRTYGKGEFVLHNNAVNKSGLLMDEVLDTEGWAENKYTIKAVSEGEDDRQFADACQRVGKHEGHTFLPQETSFESIDRVNNIGVLSIHPSDWIKLEKSFSEFMSSSKYNFLAKKWVFSKNVSTIAIQIIKQ